MGAGGNVQRPKSDGMMEDQPHAQGHPRPGQGHAHGQPYPSGPAGSAGPPGSPYDHIQRALGQQQARSSPALTGKVTGLAVWN